MSILSYCNISDFLKSLENGDSKILTAVPGIGKTKAEKILFEAKGKQKKLENVIAKFTSTDITLKKLPESDLISSILLDSLETLGFHRKEVALAEKKIQVHESNLPELNKDTIQLWIRTYLKYL
jgi:Holliday junction resolvasome RuvABC DNA-binding subunit